MLKKQAFVYILFSKKHGTLYTGVTSDLTRRINEHKNGLVGFSKRYGVSKCGYFELCESMAAAISREKAIKGGSRARKIALIESINPKWEDLSESLV